MQFLRGHNPDNVIILVNSKIVYSQIKGAVLRKENEKQQKLMNFQYTDRITNRFHQTDLYEIIISKLLSQNVHMELH